MDALPTDPAPSAVTLSAEQPTAKSRAINGVGTQVRSSGIFLWSAKFSYNLLDFDQRNELMSFLIGAGGRALEFDVLVPTHSENDSVVSTTATPDATYASGSTTLTFQGVTGELKIGNLVRVNGQKPTYMVKDAQVNIAGNQQVTLHPPLRSGVTSSTVFLTKNVTLNMSLDEDSLDIKSKGMSSSISFSMIEEVL